MKLDTRVHLVAALEGIEKKTDLIKAIIAEAKAGEYHDYKNKKYVCGKVAANDLLQVAAKQHGDEKTKKLLLDLAERIRNGVFDEEADEEDKAAMREFCPPELRGVLGL
jgi:hypothetical protein